MYIIKNFARLQKKGIAFSFIALLCPQVENAVHIPKINEKEPCPILKILSKSKKRRETRIYYKMKGRFLNFIKINQMINFVGVIKLRQKIENAFGSNKYIRKILCKQIISLHMHI